MKLVEKCADVTLNLPEPLFTKDGVRVVAVDSFEVLADHAEAWNQLVNVPGGNPVFSHAWITAHLQTRLGEKDRWVCLLAFDEDRLVGVLPVVTTPRRWFNKKHCFRFETPCDALLTESIEPLVLQGYEQRVCPAFHDYLWAIPCCCSCLRVRGLPENRVEHATNRNVFRRSSFIVNFDSCENYIQTQESAEKYFSTLSRKFNRNYRRIIRRIEKQPGAQFQFEVGNAEENAERFMDVEHQNWKAQRKTSIRSDQSYIDQFRLLAKGMEDQGWLKWAFLDLDGQTVAAQFMVQGGQTLYVVKIGYDDRFSKYSPGAALFGRTIEWAHTLHGVKEVNFMSGYSWMKNWNVQTRKKFNVAFFPATVRRWGLCKQPMLVRSLLNRIPALREAVDGLTNCVIHEGAS